MRHLFFLAPVLLALAACGGDDDALVARVREAASRDLSCDVADVEVDASMNLDKTSATAVAGGCGRAAQYRCRTRGPRREWHCLPLAR